MRNPAELIWLELSYNYFWFDTCDAYRVGDNDVGLSYDPQPVIFDTGTTYAYVPSVLYSTFVKKIFAGKKHEVIQGTYIMRS